jgi:two-component system, sensor histidine kinase and response regulator
MTAHATMEERQRCLASGMNNHVSKPIDPALLFETRVAGNRKLYLKLLRQFVEQQGPAPAQITKALAQGDTSLAERLAHTVKGVAGSLGAAQVQHAAGLLEKAFQAVLGAEAFEAFEQQVSAFGFVEALAVFQPAVRNKELI